MNREFGTSETLQTRRQNDYCDECGGHSQHEGWCSLGTGIEKIEIEESAWFAITNTGKRIRFMMAPGVTPQRALLFAQTHSAALGLDEQPDQVVAVEGE